MTTSLSLFLQDITTGTGTHLCSGNDTTPQKHPTTTEGPDEEAAGNDGDQDEGENSMGEDNDDRTTGITKTGTMGRTKGCQRDRDKEVGE